MTSKPIGVFDSGVGGLTVVKKMSQMLPHEDIVYLGDTARVPYGSKSKETVTRFTIECLSFLKKFNVSAIVHKPFDPESIKQVLKDDLSIEIETH